MTIIIIIAILLFIPFLQGFITGISQQPEEKQKDKKSNENKENKKVIDVDAIENEIAMLQCNLERRKEAAAILETELQHCRQNRKATVLTKLNTLDKQSYKDMERITKLNGLL